MSYKTWHIVRHVEVNIPQCKPPARVRTKVGLARSSAPSYITLVTIAYDSDSR